MLDFFDLASPFIFCFAMLAVMFLLARVKTSSYQDLLNDDRWKQKRLKIIKRDGHRCKYCGSSSELQVHHKYYMKYPNDEYVDPWDYPDKAFITLCSKCHEKWHKHHRVKVYYRKYGIHYN